MGERLPPAAESVDDVEDLEELRETDMLMEETGFVNSHTNTHTCTNLHTVEDDCNVLAE